MSYPQSYYDGDAGDYGTKFPVTTLAARLAAMASLVVSVVLVQTNDAKTNNGYVYTYNNFHSYKYMFYVALVGIAYTVLQLPSALYYMLRKKHLINRYSLLKFNFYADKMAVFLLATAAGAAFGTTADMSSNKVKWEHNESKMQNFFNVGYISAAFVLLGCVATAISSIHSSLALPNTSGS